MKVDVLRGLPGSGKSSWAINQKAFVISTDDYFDTPSGWVFVPSNIGLAHLWAKKTYHEALLTGKPYVIVDNTNSSAAEIAYYYDLAQVFGYAVKIREFYCTPEISATRNIHGVPTHVISRMWESMNTVALPPWMADSVVIMPTDLPV
jgi:predicted kinase